MTHIDQARQEQFLGQAVTDMAAAISGLLVHIGDRLGLYRAMADAGPVTPEALAGQTGTASRYVREWLSNQAAGGYVTYRPQDGTFESPAEHAAVLADEDSCHPRGPMSTTAEAHPSPRASPRSGPVVHIFQVRGAVGLRRDADGPLPGQLERTRREGNGRYVWARHCLRHHQGARGERRAPVALPAGGTLAE
jgi:hypothetical protein